MLSPNLTLTVQFLKNLSAAVIPKQLTPRGRHKGKGGSPISSSLPRHGARIRTKTQSTIKQKLRADYKLAQKKYRTKIYMMHESSNVMMHALMQGDQVQFKFKFTKLA